MIIFGCQFRLETTSEIARNYCLTKGDMFVLPSRDDLVEHRVVVTTLSTSQVLLDLQVLHGFFTHILIDEAAQALEPEALTPLIYAGPNTKVVFTGDHMQVLFFIFFLILHSTTLLACVPCCCGAWNNGSHQKNRISLKKNESNRN